MSKKKFSSVLRGTDPLFLYIALRDQSFMKRLKKFFFPLKLWLMYSSSKCLNNLHFIVAIDFLKFLIFEYPLLFVDSI